MERFLANENFPFPSVKILRDSNFLVRYIPEIKRGITDEEVLDIAVKENLIILTFDRDYGELLFKYQKVNPPAVVYFRLKGSNPRSSGEILLNLLKNSNLKLANFFTVVEENGIRQRILG
jgi:predicted nuclease of predicted toxin-antitoxin system